MVRLNIAAPLPARAAIDSVFNGSRAQSRWSADRKLMLLVDQSPLAKVGQHYPRRLLGKVSRPRQIGPSRREILGDPLEPVGG